MSDTTPTSPEGRRPRSSNGETTGAKLHERFLQVEREADEGLSAVVQKHVRATQEAKPRLPK